MSPKKIFAASHNRVVSILHILESIHIKQIWSQESHLLQLLPQFTQSNWRYALQFWANHNQERTSLCFTLTSRLQFHHNSLFVKLIHIKNRNRIGVLTYVSEHGSYTCYSAFVSYILVRVQEYCVVCIYRKPCSVTKVKMKCQQEETCI